MKLLEVYSLSCFKLARKHTNQTRPLLTMKLIVFWLLVSLVEGGVTSLVAMRVKEC